MADRPTNVYKLANIEVAEWERQTQEGKTYKTYSVQKSYKDASGQWKHTGSFMASELPVLASVLLQVVGKNIRTNNASGTNGSQAAESEEVPF